MRIGVKNHNWGKEIIGHTNMGKTSMAYGLALKSLGWGKTVLLATDDVDAKELFKAFTNVIIVPALAIEVVKAVRAHQFDIVILDCVRSSNEKKDEMIRILVADGVQIYLFRAAMRNEMVGEV